MAANEEHMAKAITVMRARHDFGPEVPDEAIAKTRGAQQYALAFAVEDLREAVLTNVPRPFRRLARRLTRA